MKHWLAATVFLIVMALAIIGLVFVSVALIQRLHLEPLTERILSMLSAVTLMIGVGVLFKTGLSRLQRR